MSHGDKFEYTCQSVFSVTARPLRRELEAILNIKACSHNSVDVKQVTFTAGS
jgi:hypothetical protein